MRVPQALEDLPYAGYLDGFDGELIREGDYREVLVADRDFEGFDAGNSRLGESAFTGVSFTNGGFPRTRMNDVWFDRTRWVGVDLADTEWLDVTALSSFFAGVTAYGGRFRRVTFQECKIDTLNLRGATVRDVVFDRCELSEVDVTGATLTNVTFPGSAVRRLRLDKATLRKVDLREATELDIASGHESLRGAVIDTLQLAELAPELARALGIVVKNR